MHDAPGGFADLPILAELGEQVRAAALRSERAPRARRSWSPARRPGRSLAVAVAMLLAVVASAAAATLLALRGTVIPAPSPRDLPAEMTPRAGTSRVSEVRAADPGGGPPFTVRVARSRTGLVCGTVGQVRDGQFGIVGLDGRFRRLPDTILDGCGQARTGAATLLGARVFDADRPADVRTVVYGVGGAGLQRAQLIVGGTTQALRLGVDGTFAAVLRGYPEDRGPQLALRFAGGAVERRSFGVKPGVVPDPGGAGAWKTEVYGVSDQPQLCVQFFTVRQPRDPVQGPAACGLRGRTPWFADVRRLTPGDRGAGTPPWDWGRHAARTVAWGYARRARRVVLLGAGGPRDLALSRGGAFLAVLPGDIDPAGLVLELTLRDGTVQRSRGAAHLVAPPKLRKPARRRPR
jgi:hypothetical protein